MLQFPGKAKQLILQCSFLDLGRLLHQDHYTSMHGYEFLLRFFFLITLKEKHV